MLSKLQNFRNEFFKVFEIAIDAEFPIGAYFGEFSEVAQCMRELYAVKESNATRLYAPCEG